MTYEFMLQEYENGKLNTKFDIKEIHKINQNIINREYNILEHMFDDQIVYE
jgi:hypothetical protein